MTPLAQSIYKTLAFFDAEGLALTLMELKSYLMADNFASISLSSIQNSLQTELRDKIGYKNGFYFLAPHENMVGLRNTHYRVSLERFRKTKKFLYWLRYIPYLRAVAISGSQALVNSAESSDIDLFIVTAKNRIWLARTMISFYFHIFRARRHGKYIRARFCLNHYLAADTAISQDKNLYTAVEYASLYPVIGAKNLEKFWRINPWAREFLASPVYEQTGIFDYQFSFWQKILETVLDYSVGPLLNYLSGIYQKHRIKMQDYILVSDQELSFHPGSTGQKVLAKFAHSTSMIDT